MKNIDIKEKKMDRSSIDIIEQSEYFDKDYYLRTYPIPREIDPAEHYLLYGWKLCYDPSENFSTSGYLFKNPDVIKEKINPLCHFENKGRKENRKMVSSLEVIESTVIFNPYFYISENLNSDMNYSETDAAKDYLERGWVNNLPVSFKYDLTAYLDGLPEDEYACVPLLHYIIFSCNINAVKINSNILKNIEIISTSKYFDEKYYRNTYGISPNVNAARHYYEFGARRMYDPSEIFSTSGYLLNNPDAFGKNALLHYVSVGRIENRSRTAFKNPLENPRSKVRIITPNSEHTISYNEETLFELASRLSEAQQSDYLKRISDPFYFNALSELRSNCVEWISTDKDDKVLIFGSGYGELVRGFAPWCGSVLCFETNEVQTFINEMINRDFDNVEYCAAETADDFFEYINSEKFDCIVMTDAFGNASEYYPSEKEPQLRLLGEAKKLLSDKGKIVIACDNPYGFKFFNGSLRTDNSLYFETLTHTRERSAPAVFTKAQLEELCSKAGFDKRKFFYPFPDYHIAFSIFTDEYTPRNGEMSAPFYTWEKNKVTLFDENEAFYSAAERNCFEIFSNSYIVVLSPQKEDNDLLYVKYSNNRGEALRIKTEIRKAEGSQKKVAKLPTSKFSKRHIHNLYKHYNKLRELYGNSEFRFNMCSYSHNRANLEFVEGKSLYAIVTDHIKAGDFESAFAEFDKIYDLLQTNKVNFVPGRKFRSAFGNVNFTEALDACPISNIDLILQNIIIDSSGKYNVLDYEWTFYFPVPILYILFRSILYLSNDSKNEIPQSFYDEFYLRYGMTPELNAIFRQMEINFQSYILAGYTSIQYMHKNNHLSLTEKPMQFFEDHGEGFSPKFKKSNAVLNLNGIITAKIYVDEDIRRLRVDPCTQKCIVKVLGITDSRGMPLEYKTNGSQIGDMCYMYRHNDPYFVLNKLDSVVTPQKIITGENYVNVKLEILRFTANISRSIR